MKISNRLKDFATPAIRKLVPYADKARSLGKRIYSLNIGQPDIKTPLKVLKRLKSFDSDIISYGHSAGELDLRKALAKYYNTFNKNISYEDILVTVGGSESLLFAFLTLCNQNDNVVVLEPFYTNIKSFAFMASVDLKPVTTTIEEGFKLPSIDEFEKAIDENTKAISICTPNNPTGYAFNDEELLAILKICRKYNLFLICDEVYREFVYDDGKVNSVLKFDEYKDLIVVCDSFSKRYSMCGSRIGMLISQNKEVIANALKLSQARLCPPKIEQILALVALDGKENEITLIKEEYQRRRDTLYNELSKIEDITIYKPKGAFYMIVDLKVDDAEEFIKFMLQDFDHNNESVFVSPANGFYVNRELGKSQVRIAYVLKVDDLKRACYILSLGLKAYKSK